MLCYGTWAPNFLRVTVRLFSDLGNKCALWHWSAFYFITVSSKKYYHQRFHAFSLPAYLPMLSEDLSKSPFRKLSLMYALILQVTWVFLTSSVIALIWRKPLFNIQGVQLVQKNSRKRELNLTVNYGLFQKWMSIPEYF